MLIGIVFGLTIAALILAFELMMTVAYGRAAAQSAQRCERYARGSFRMPGAPIVFNKNAGLNGADHEQHVPRLFWATILLLVVLRVAEPWLNKNALHQAPHSLIEASLVLTCILVVEWIFIYLQKKVAKNIKKVWHALAGYCLVATYAWLYAIGCIMLWKMLH